MSAGVLDFGGFDYDFGAPASAQSIQATLDSAESFIDIVGDTNVGLAVFKVSFSAGIFRDSWIVSTSLPRSVVVKISFSASSFFRVSLWWYEKSNSVLIGYGYRRS